MTRIGSVDQVLLLLRERLQRMDRSRADTSRRADAMARATPGPLARLQAMAAVDQLSDDDLGRTMIRALLADELGEGIANDPAFQSVIEDVARIIGESEEGRKLMERAMRELRTEP